MKRLFPILLAAILFLSSCTPASYPEVQAETDWNVTENITFSLEYDTYPVGVESMRMILKNKSDNAIMYGLGWAFERYEKGEWIPVAIKDNIGFESIGYILSEHSQDPFEISTWFLKEPLKEGTYRVTGCKLYEEGVEPGGQREEYPPYQFIFRISKDAQSPIKASEDELPKEDWEWMTDWEILPIYEAENQSIWKFVKGNDGLIALLYRDDTPENEILQERDLLKLDIFDRKTGKRYPVYQEPTVTIDQVQSANAGFKILYADEYDNLIKFHEGELIFGTPRPN